jgi:transposase-like protein
MDFVRDYPDDATCLDYLWRRLYSPDGGTAECPKCEKTRRFHRVASRPSYSCDTCGHHIHPTAGTIFHKSSTSLHLWFHAIFLMAQTRCGISAKQLERELRVTYKTAWRMFHQIRSMLGEDGSAGLLSGTVEVDETFIGGKPRAGQIKSKKDIREWTERKAKVVGAVQRGGRISATIAPDRTAETLGAFVQARVLPASTVYTDEFKSYRGLGKAGYQHSRINHSEKVYVHGDVHTQTIEGFWALLKNGLRGVYHGVGTQHLQSYLDEYTFRYNHRDDARGMFPTMLTRAIGG